MKNRRCSFITISAVINLSLYKNEDPPTRNS